MKFDKYKFDGWAYIKKNDYSLVRFAPFGTLNGGKGSGNFGHAGRPGLVGGSSSGADKFVEKKTDEIIERAKVEEKTVSADLKKVFSENGTTFAGFDFRLKSKGSLSRKIKSDAIDSNGKKGLKSVKMLAEAANKINDNLRYTCISDERGFGKRVRSVMNDLEAKGYEFVKVKNTMADTRGGYRGINTQVKNKNGYIFELQFHTAKSFETKEGAHKYYEIVRDKNRSDSEKNLALGTMKAYYKRVPMPDDCDLIKPFNKL